MDECKKDGIEPYKSYSGKVTARLTPERHQALAVTTQATSHSINDLLNEGADMVMQKYS
ncbi:toxin-antitoxin system HicB family antitoxin [Yersinia enterocolitica]|uniref:toxin-antitoxin system HicB family antitoxin n=1 Tax=Yersinia enterocolitica TaxID=630 RepID=UPI003AB1F3D3